MSNDLSVEVTTDYVDGFATKHLVKAEAVYNLTMAELLDDEDEIDE